MTGQDTPRRSPLIPPLWFVDALNVSEARRGKPRLGIMDPLTLLLWHTYNEVAIRPGRFLIPGAS